MKRLAVGGCVITVLAGALSISAGSSATGSPAIVSVAPAPRIPSGATKIGAVPATTNEKGALVLRPRDEAALQQFIGAVTDPQSPQFHQYLAPGAFAARFGPSQATVQAVTARLSAEGLDVTNVAGDNLVVSFTGSASALGRAFHTGLERYKLADGTTGQATTSSVSVPSSIAGSVTAVVGLNELAHAQAQSLVRAPASARGTHAAAKTGQFSHPSGSPTPCADAQADAQQFGGLTDDQIADAYGAFGLYDSGDLGAGQHIAVYELEPFTRSEIQTFDTCYFGEAAAAQMAERLSVVPVEGGQPAGESSGESALDIEDVSAFAPGASIEVYEAPNTESGLVGQYAAIVNADKDQVVSTSWGLCEQAVQLGEPGVQQAENLLFEQAAAQGQSIFAAAGDTGSDDCNEYRYPYPPAGQNPLSVMDPASQPYVVAVGGTTISDASTDPPQEHVWNDGAEWGAGGGGISMSWAMPSWQLYSRVPGTVLPGSSDYAQGNAIESRYGYPQGFCQAYLPGASAQTPCRTLPDVSAQADEFTGAVTVYEPAYEYEVPDGWTTFGGTSSATPIWAALLAVANASSTCKENALTANGIGFVNPLLYGVASEPSAYKASFNDITSGNNDIYGLDNGLVFGAGTGYDLASGLGSPRLTGKGGKAGLAYYLCSYASATRKSRPVVTGLSPGQLSTSGGSVTITGTGFKAGRSADVAGITIGTWQIPASQITVTSKTSLTATFPPASDTLPAESPAPLDGAGPAAVTVTLTDGQSSAPSPASTLQYVDETSSAPVPAITGVSPYGGSETAPAQVKIFGSGFIGASEVTFGGVPASGFTVVSPYEITLTPPAYSVATACAPNVPGETPTSDICQVQVQVTNPQGASATSKILPPYEGTLPFTPMGVYGPPPGCECEAAPAPTEFDYAPTPTISSVSTSTAEPGSLASEHGGTLITVSGTGLDPQTFEYADFGNPELSSSVSFAYEYLSGTEMQILAPAIALSTDPTTLPFSVRTLAGQSPEASVTYAGVPTVSSALNTATGRNGGPATGQTPITVTGEGFANQLLGVQFAGRYSVGTQYSFTVNSDTSLSTQTVAQNPALVDVQPCTVTGCSLNPPDDYFYLYPPGSPRVESISPASGPAKGGTQVAISGQNLGCVTGVFFGTVPAKTFSNGEQLLDCGSSTLVNAIAPSGTAGKKVKVTVTTVESEFTESGPSESTASFAYTR